MRNLKRALSLTLASVMLLGMMVVGSSAASYPDVDENDNIEAIEVLQAVKVMVGDDNGNFGPDDQVNRAQMAVVMALLLDLDYDYYKGSDPGFWDVPSWAAPYVAACYANGIVSGYGNGQYGSGDPVTAVQAASMMMRALGYFKYQSDYANGFELSTVTQASKIELFKGVNAASNTTALTRNQVAKMALNALQTPIVEPDDNTLNITTSAGNATTTVTGGRVNYTVVSSTQSFARAIDDTERSTNDLAGRGGYTVELGEKLYSGELKLNEDAVDEFGRPSRQWEYKGDKIGTYAKKEQLRAEYTKKVTGLDLYDLLGNEVVKANSEWDLFVYVDGEDRYNADNNNGVKTVFDRTEINKNNKAAVGGTGNGVLTQVYVDADKKEATIAIINTYLAIAKADYNEKKDEVSFDVHAINKDSNNNYYKVEKACENDDEDKKAMTITGEDFAIAESIKKDEAYLVNVAQGEIQVVKPVEVLNDTVLSAFKQYDWVETDGTKYSYASTAEYKYNELDAYTGSNNNDTINLKDQNYKVYLDPYGYLIGIELIESVKNYVFITGVNTEDNYLAARSQKANAIFLDGTMETITYNVEKSDNIINASDPALTNTWCTYTVNNAGVYTLKQVVGTYTEDGDGYDVGDSRVDNGNGIKVGQYHDKTSTDIDVKHVSLRGSDGTERQAFKYVYGNDDTIYLNAKIKTVKVSGTTRGQGIITDVASVTTGIDNASLKLLDNDDAAETAKKNSASPKQFPDKVGPGETGDYETAEGAYVLYDKDGYVIAAITVAKDSASTKNLVYVNSSKAEEHYSSAADEWTWYREVVFNGEKVNLKEVGDGISIVENLKQHNWYVVSYNAKGEVISATHAYDELDHTNEYEDTIEDLAGTINAAGAETVLYENTLFNKLTAAAPDGCPDYDAPVANGVFGDPHTPNAVHDPDGPNLEGSMFYVRTDDKTGFYVDKDVKAVFIQTNRNGETTEIETGVTALKTFIEDLNAYGDEHVSCACGTSHTTKYCYEVSAVITGGRAKVVVIRDLHKQGDGGNKPTGGGENTDGLYVDASTPNAVTIDYTTDNVPGHDEGIDAITKELENNLGYLVEQVEWNSTSSTYDFYASKTNANGKKITVIYKWDPDDVTQQYNITVAGKGTYRIDTTAATSWSNVINAIDSAEGTSLAAGIGNHVKVGDYYYTTAASTGIANNVTVDIGYYKLAVTQAVTDNAANDDSGTVEATLTSAQYVKKADTNVTVKIETAKATLNGGIKLALTTPTATNGSAIKGTGIIKATGAEEFEITVALKAGDITGAADITIAFEMTDAPATITVKLDGVPKEATDADTMKTFLAKNSVTGKENVYFLVTEGDGSTTRMVNSTEDTAKLKNGDQIVTTTKYIEVNNTTPVADNGSNITSNSDGGNAVTVGTFALETGKVQDTDATKSFVAVGGDVVLSFNLTVATADGTTTAAINVAVTADAANAVTITSGTPIASGSTVETGGTEYTVTVKIMEDDLADTITGATQFKVKLTDS